MRGTNYLLVQFLVGLLLCCNSPHSDADTRHARHPFHKICEGRHKVGLYDSLMIAFVNDFKPPATDCDSLISAIEKAEKIDLSRFFGFTDLNLLKGFPNTKFLELHQSGVTNIDDIASVFPNLEVLSLNVAFVPYKDLNGLSRLTKLTGLWLDGQKEVIDFTPVLNLPNLEFLSLNSSNIDHIDFMASDKLQYLRLANTKIRDLAFLRKYKSLKSLCISNSGLRPNDVPIHVENLVYK